MFAANLRRAVERRGAVARLADRTGISRVQINRYLNGTIPNEPNLAAIAEALGMAEHRLFQEADGLEWAGGRDLAQLARLSSNLGEQAATHRSIILYFEVPGEPGFVVRSPMRVWDEAGCQMFKRYTKFGTGPSTSVNDPLSTHFGVVSVVKGVELYSGYRQQQPHEPSLIRIVGASDFRRFAKGRASVYSLSGPTDLSVVAERSLNELAEAEAIELAGLVPSSVRLGSATVATLLTTDAPTELAFGR